MMYEMRWRKSEPTFLLTKGIFNLSHHIGMVWEDLAFDDTVSEVSVREVLMYNSNAEQCTTINTLRFIPGSSTGTNQHLLACSQNNICIR